MKNALRLLALAALATVFALPAYAQDAAAAPAATPTGPCTEADAKAAVYKRFTDNFKGTPDQQKVAYDAGKEYLNKYGACPDAADKQIADYVQKWVGKYEKAVVEFNCTEAVNKTPLKAFQACQQLLAANPDNLKVYLALVTAGLKNVQAKNTSTNAQAADAARRALVLVEKGGTSDVWLPFTSQQEAAPGLNYYLGFFTLENSPAEAARYLVKAAQSTSSFSKEPSTYDFLALAYFNSEFKPLAAEYKAKYEGKEATPESEAMLNKINAVTHRIVDAYARAVALSPAGAAKEDRRNKLVPFYKQLHDGSDAGLNALLASVLSKPIMLPGQEPAPVASPSTTGANGAGGATTTTPASAQPAGATAKPAASTTTPAKPATAQKPPRN
ncbi:MAG: hypothetical protein LC795_07060 [Acidobacteria bacterium]|nr:hypothetical protein [Acidobacteriota bacterium]